MTARPACSISTDIENGVVVLVISLSLMRVEPIVAKVASVSSAAVQRIDRV